MAKNVALIDKSLIQNLSYETDNNNSRNIIYQISDMLDDITIDLASYNKYININNVDSKVFGDFATKTSFPDSDLNFYLLIKSGQLELNTIKELQNKRKILWRKIKLAWANIKKKNKKRKFFAKKNKKKNKEFITEDELKEKKEALYTIINIKEDYFEYIAKYMSEMTVIYNKIDKITILSKEDLGYNINIIPAFVHDDELRVWNFNTNKFKSIFFNNAIIALENKNEEINRINYSQNNSQKILKINDNKDIFLKLIRIYKSITNNLLQTKDLDFIDSLIYNCPNEIFEGNIYDVFVRSINYLKNADIADFRSVYNLNVSLYEQHDLTIYDIKKLIKEISVAITNE